MTIDSVTPTQTQPITRTPFSRRSALIVGMAGLLTGQTALGQTAYADEAADNTLIVRSGETVTVAATRRLVRLVIEDGGVIEAPEGYSLTLTVNRVETGSTIPNLYDNDGIVTYIGAGTYTGAVVITVAVENIVDYQDREWPIRQAIYVDAGGIDEAKSVLSAIRAGQYDDARARNLQLRSTGESFNGIWVAGGDYQVVSPDIRFDGNARSDFIGYGAAIVGTGGSHLVIDKADIHNRGVVRTTVVADGGATVIVKNSDLSVRDGVLPPEYENTGDLAFMMSCPWLLGMYGTVRAVNILGEQTKAVFLNTKVTTQTWGALSVDVGNQHKLIVANCTIKNTGSSGYGTYVIGDVTEHLLGNTFDVGTYATISWGGSAHYGDSSPAAIAALNAQYGLGLTAADIAAVTHKASVVTSRKFGFMYQGRGGTLLIDGGTKVTTARSTFLSKAAQSNVTVSGSRVRLRPGTGVIYQLMDNDNPGSAPAPPDRPWTRVYTNSYVQPTGPAVKSETWNPAEVHATDATGTFHSGRLAGDFYNGVLGGGNGNIQGMNLVLTFTNTVVRGVISAATTVHGESPIGYDNYDQLGVVENTASAVVNNGVIVSLYGNSVWNVTGTSYLSKLTIGAKSRIRGASRMTVDGTEVAIAAGTYTGAITIEA